MRTCSDASQVFYLGTPIAFHCNSLCHDRTTRLSSHMINASGGLVVCVACAGLAVRFSRLQQQQPITTNYGTRPYPISLCSIASTSSSIYTDSGFSSSTATPLPIEAVSLPYLTDTLQQGKTTLAGSGSFGTACRCLCTQGEEASMFHTWLEAYPSSLCLQVALPSLAPLIKLIRISSCE